MRIELQFRYDTESGKFLVEVPGLQRAIYEGATIAEAAENAKIGICAILKKPVPNVSGK